MTITVTFNSMEEFQSFFAKPPVREAEPKRQEVPKPDTKSAELVPKPTPEPSVVPDEKVSRVEIRRHLAELNKKTGTNTAAKLIKSIGYGKLTEVPEEKLLELKERIKEEEKCLQSTQS